MNVKKHSSLMRDSTPMKHAIEFNCLPTELLKSVEIEAKMEEPVHLFPVFPEINSKFFNYYGKYSIRMVYTFSVDALRSSLLNASMELPQFHRSLRCTSITRTSSASS